MFSWEVELTLPAVATRPFMHTHCRASLQVEDHRSQCSERGGLHCICRRGAQDRLHLRLRIRDTSQSRCAQHAQRSPIAPPRRRTT
jgi:hypothetical protein